MKDYLTDERVYQILRNVFLSPEDIKDGFLSEKFFEKKKISKEKIIRLKEIEAEFKNVR